MQRPTRLKKKIYTFNYFDSSFVCFRDSQENINIFDAYCPHLGAHLGMGKLMDDHITCPFHAWKYNSQGSCVEIPYCQRIPKRARLKRYPAKEIDKKVYFYFTLEDGLRDPDIAPADIPSWQNRYSKNILTLKIENKKLHHLWQVLKLTGDLKKHAPGIFQFQTTNQKLALSFLILTTPINHTFFQLFVAMAFKKTFNPLRLMGVKKVYRSVKLLLAEVGVS